MTPRSDDPPVPPAVQPLAYEAPFDPEVARLEPVDGGVVFVLPPQHTFVLVFELLGSLFLLAVALPAAALTFALRMGWLPPTTNSRGEPMGTIGQAVLISLWVAGGTLLTLWCAGRLFARCRGVRQPQRRRVPRRTSASARIGHQAATVKAIRLAVWTCQPGWGVQIIYGQGKGYRRHVVVRTGKDRGPAETLAAELRCMWDLPDGEGD